MFVSIPCIQCVIQLSGAQNKVEMTQSVLKLLKEGAYVLRSSKRLMQRICCCGLGVENGSEARFP